MQARRYFETVDLGQNTIEIRRSGFSRIIHSQRLFPSGTGLPGAWSGGQDQHSPIGKPSDRARFAGRKYGMTGDVFAPFQAPKVFRFTDIDQFRSSVRDLSVDFTPLVRAIS